jgi:hypothetical protein
VPTHRPLAPDIEHLRQQFEQIATDGHALVDPLTDEQFTWRPEPGTWSIADCLDHLNTTAREYLPVLDDSIADAIRRGLYGQGPFRWSWFGRLLLLNAEPPVRLRLPASPGLQPPRDPRARGHIMAAFRGYQVQYVDRLRQANGLHLGRARVRAPISHWITLQLGCGFALMAAHERRHLWQARQVMARPGFPVAAEPR